MNKQTFSAALERQLSGLPRQDIQHWIEFYGEMIDDRMEEGMTEEEAVAQIGSVEEIAAQILSQNPPSRPVPEKTKPRHTLRVWEIVLLALGSPIWVSLLIAAIAVVFSGFVVVWSVVISLWAVAVSVAACVLGGILSAILFCVLGHGWAGLAMLGAGLTCAGLAILLFFGCKELTKGIALLTRKLFMRIHSRFTGKGDK